MIKVFAKDGYLVVGTEGVYPISTIDYSVANDLLTIYSPYVERNGEPFRVLFEVPVSQISDVNDTPLTPLTIGGYLATQWTSKAIATLSQSDKDDIVAEAVSQVNANSGSNDLGTLNSDPPSPADGQFWYNSTDGKMKYKTPIGVAAIDTEETLTTDAFGNPITIE